MKEDLDECILEATGEAAMAMHPEEPVTPEAVETRVGEPTERSAAERGSRGSAAGRRATSGCIAVGAGK